MQKEQLPKYDFLFLGGINNTYIFETASQIAYEIKFKPSEYLFEEYEEFKYNIYEFSLLIAYNPYKKSPSLDKFIPQTVADIVQDFLKKEERIALYICDSSDSKEAARARKFGHWFSYMNNGSFVKYETIISDVSANYYISVILRGDHPYKIKILTAFDELTTSPQK